MSKKIYYIINVGVSNQKSNASVNRVRSIVEGINMNGGNAELILPYSKNYKFKIFNKINAIIKIFYLLFMSNRGDIFVLYGISSFLKILFLFKNKVKIFVEITEYPYSIINPEFKSQSKVEQSTLKLFSKLDGFITCSYALKDYYRKYLKDAPILIVPLIVKVSAFQKAVKAKERLYPYIGYCGSLDNNKDGVPNLIKAFSKIHFQFPKLKLLIAGGGSKKTIKELNSIIKEFEISDKVILIGKIDHIDIPSFLKGAKVLALARPDNKQAQGGVPSKIGEYLAAGVPTVLTNVGELPRYLKNGEDCFLIEPDSIDLFANGLVKALISSKREEISKHSLNTALRFDIKNQGKIISDFLTSN